jgi:DNA-binding NarL/FixJ family response regulator
VPNTVKILIVDQYPVIRFGLAYFLEKQWSFEIVGEAGSIDDAIQQVRSHKPDVIVMDVFNFNGDGIEATREILREQPGNILAFSKNQSWDNISAFLHAGGLGFVLKQSSLTDLVTAINAVAEGNVWISPSVRKVTSASAQKPKTADEILSTREREIAMLVARGLTSSQIADQLCVSRRTVESHRYRIFKRLKIESRAQLVTYAIEHGLL